MAEANRSRPIVVAGKGTANYTLAIATRYGEGEERIILRARGRHIAAAFDAANAAINMGLMLTRGNVRWGQEELAHERFVSWVEIELDAIPDSQA